MGYNIKTKGLPKEIQSSAHASEVEWEWPPDPAQDIKTRVKPLNFQYLYFQLV